MAAEARSSFLSVAAAAAGGGRGGSNVDVASSSINVGSSAADGLECDSNSSDVRRTWIVIARRGFKSHYVGF